MSTRKPSIKVQKLDFSTNSVYVVKDYPINAAVRIKKHGSNFDVLLISEENKLRELETLDVDQDEANSAIVKYRRNMRDFARKTKAGDMETVVTPISISGPVVIEPKSIVTFTSEEPITTQEPKSTPKKSEPKMSTTSTSANPLEAMISEIAMNAINPIVDELQKAAKIAPREIVIKNPEQAIIKAGVQHSQFDEVMYTLAAQVPLCLVGPAGSGKTTVAKKAAEVLGLNFASKSVSAQTGAHEFFGYMDANGNYVSTLFRDLYENGGVFLLDEFDAGNPNVLAALNQATANEECAFADKMVEKHPDFNIIMAGNTYGSGATAEYVGRNKIDAATLDRFAFCTFNYDETLEMALATNKDWCEFVQATRRLAAIKKIRTIISPRATFNGQRMIAAGMPIDKVKQMVLYKGLTDNEIDMLKSSN